jgi:hypothetical protein
VGAEWKTVELTVTGTRASLRGRVRVGETPVEGATAMVVADPTR